MNDEENDDERQCEALQIETEPVVQVLAAPEKIEPPHGIRDLAQGESPGLGQREHLAPWNPRAWRHRRRIAADIGQFGCAHTRIYLGRLVDLQPDDDPRQAEDPGDQKRVLPVRAVRQHEHRNYERRQNGPHIGARVENAVGEGPLPAREPFPRRLDRRGKIAGFAKPETEAGQAETQKAERRAHERVEHPKKAPDGD
jgi:hypothetical protein